MEIKKYITENEPKMLEDLFSLIRIPSISAKPEHHDDMLACAERWAQLLLEAGADEALVMPSKGNEITISFFLSAVAMGKYGLSSSIPSTVTSRLYP